MQNFAASTMVAGEFGKEKDGQFKEGNNSDTSKFFWFIDRSN